METEAREVICKHCQGIMMTTKVTWSYDIYTCAHCGAEVLIDMYATKEWWREPLHPPIPPQ